MAVATKQFEIPESACDRCGKCCYYKIYDKNGNYLKSIPCQYFDTTTHLCKVYKDRFSKQHMCEKVDLEFIKRSRGTDALPDSCNLIKYCKDAGVLK